MSTRPKIRIDCARWLLVVLASAFLLHGCSCVIPVSVRGSLDGGIVFTLDESREVYYAGVWARDTAGQWQESWRIEGEGDVLEIKYGQVPKGLSLAMAAQPLEKNRRYKFHVEEQGFWAPCVGSIGFVVTEDGSVEECDTEECTRRFIAHGGRE